MNEGFVLRAVRGCMKLGKIETGRLLGCDHPAAKSNGRRIGNQARLKDIMALSGDSSLRLDVRDSVLGISGLGINNPSWSLFET